MRQHRVELRFTATEAFEQRHWLFRTAAGQDVIEERLTGLTVEDAFLFKAGEGVCRQHVGPHLPVLRAVAEHGDGGVETPERVGRVGGEMLFHRGVGGAVAGAIGKRYGGEDPEQ